MTVKILVGDCRDILATLPDESMHCVVTSPPYWGLRDYGTATWEGGDLKCDHKPPIDPQLHVGSDEKLGRNNTNWDHRHKSYTDSCGKCGARRIDSQLGLEPDFRDYLKTMVEVFREVKRVLRKDGTLWLNMGDNYVGAVNGRSARDSKIIGGDDRTFRDKPFSNIGNGLKAKDMAGMPWRLAFALQEDGWWLRSDIIWSKPNPMPESIGDRPTKAHEYMFLLAKSERYYYDAEAIKEEGSGRCPGNVNYKYDGLDGHETKQGILAQSSVPQLTRNRRTVWEIATSPFSEAHFATFPPALVEPCIKAGCPKDGTVLDPFGGAGTVGLVADRLGRNAILIELNPEYAKMAENRLSNDAGLFSSVEREAPPVGGGAPLASGLPARGG